MRDAANLTVPDEELRSYIDPPTADLGRRAVHGATLAFLSRGMRLAINLVNLAVLTRLLTPDDFGIMAMSVAITGFVAMFNDMGLTTPTIQRKEISQSLLSWLWILNIGVSLLAMIAGWIVAPFAAIVFQNNAIGAVIAVSVIAFPVSAIAAQHMALFTRRMNWWIVQFVPLGCACGGMAIAILLAWFSNLGYWSIVAGNLFEIASRSAILWMLSPWRPSWVKDRFGLSDSVRFGANLTAFNAVNYFHRSSDNLILGIWHTAAAVGYYARAYSLFILPLTALITPLGSSIIPAMSRAESDAQWCTIYLRAITFAMVIAAPIAVAFTVFPHEIVSLLYGKGWGPSANLVAIFGPAMMIQPIYSSMGWLYISRGDARGMLRASIPASTVYLMAFLIGVQWGPEGLATGYVFASYIVIPVWIWWAVRRTPLSIRAVTTCVAGPMVSASAAGALIVVIGWSREDSFLFRISFFCALYGALIGILVLAIPSLRALVTRWVTDRRLLNPNSNG